MSTKAAAAAAGSVPGPQADGPPQTRADAEGDLFLGPRVLPVPGQLSAQAKQAIAAAWSVTLPTLPEGSADLTVWRKAIAARDAALQPLLAGLLASARGTVEKRKIAGVTVFRGAPERIAERHVGKAILYVRGGAFVLDAEGRFAEALAPVLADQFGCVVYSVRYRTAPDHPFPAAVDDVMVVYRELLKEYNAKNLAIAGMSAGGSIAPGATLMLRDQGFPMPAMMILDTPLVDLTEGGGGDSIWANAGIDSVLRGGLRGPIAVYAGDRDRTNPYMSPLFGDFTKGFPPTLIITGTRDLLLSNSVLMHRALRRADVPADLHVVDAASHGGFRAYSTEVPEDNDMLVERRRFLSKYW